MAQDCGPSVAVTSAHFVAVLPTKLTKSEGNSTPSSQIECPRVLLEPGGRDGSNGIWLVAVA